MKGKLRISIAAIVAILFLFAGVAYATVPASVLIYDGDPEQGGTLIAAKQVFAGSIAPEGSSVWLEWTPTTIGPHRLYAVLQQSVFDPAPGENTGILKVEVIPVPPGLSE